MDAFEVLVIILSVTLVILLVASIVFVISLIKLTKEVRNLTLKAEDVMDGVESVSNFFRKSATPMAITGLISNIVSVVGQYKNKRSKDNG